MNRGAHDTLASPPSPTETESDTSSTVRDVTPGPSHTIGTSAPADAAAINEDSQIVNGKKQDEAEKKPQSGKPFSSFTQNQKWGIVIMSSIAGLFSPISSVILAPSLPILVEQFQRSSEDINLTMTLYLYVRSPSESMPNTTSDRVVLAQSVSRPDAVILGLIIRQYRSATGLHHDPVDIRRSMYRAGADTDFDLLATPRFANGASYWRLRSHCHR